MKKQVYKQSIFKNRQPERLEEREVLAGHGFGAQFYHMMQDISVAALIQQAHAQSAISNAQIAARGSIFAALGGEGGSSSAQRTVLSAHLTDPENSAASATVKYKTYTSSDGTTETELKVKVTGAAASTTLDIAINGTVVGQVSTDANGKGTAEFSSNPDDSDEQALPADFPTDIAAGATVTVGTLSGTLATGRLGHTCGGGCHGGEESGTRLSTALTDPENSAASGTATYSSRTYDGTTTTKFSVSVSGTTPSTSLDITIDGTVIGQVATDASGAGTATFSSNPTGTEQALSANFPTTVAADTKIGVGTLSGTLATSSASESAVRFGARHFHR